MSVTIYDATQQRLPHIAHHWSWWERSSWISVSIPSRCVAITIYHKTITISISFWVHGISVVTIGNLESHIPILNAHLWAQGQKVWCTFSLSHRLCVAATCTVRWLCSQKSDKSFGVEHDYVRL